MSDEYTLIVVDNGNGNGETLVRIWTTGKVDADYRRTALTGWLPVQLQGGSVRLEGSDGRPVDELCVVGAGVDAESGSVSRDVLGWSLFCLTLLMVFVAGPAGNGWITW